MQDAYSGEFRDKVIAHCASIGQPKLAARILFHRQQRHWRQVAILSQPWPEEEPGPLEQIEVKIDRIQSTIEKGRKPKEIVVYRERPQPKETAIPPIIGFVA